MTAGASLVLHFANTLTKAGARGVSPSGLPPGFCPALRWPEYVSGLLK